MITILESPYSGDVEGNLAYLRACMRSVLLDGGTPFASHALYTQPGVLDDSNPEERNLGMVAGWRMYRHASRALFCLDRGVAKGMAMGAIVARSFGVRAECVWLDNGALHGRIVAIELPEEKAAVQKLRAMACDPELIAEVGRLLG